MLSTSVGRPLAEQFRLVAAGGAAGAVVRYRAGALVEGAGTTLALNVLGSLLLGWMAARYRRSGLWLAAGTGFCGGLTSFSTFAFDVATWLDRGDVVDGIGLVVTTVVGAVGAAFTGFALGSRTPGRRT